MTGLVIDEHGRARPEGSQSLAARARAAGTFYDVPEGFLQSGFIYLRPLSRTLIVALSPHLVCRRAVAAAFFEIARQNPGRVDLLCYGARRSWRETLSPAGEVFERIDRIVSDAIDSAPRGLLAARLRLDVIDRVARSRLTSVLEAWEEVGGVWSPGLYARMREERLLDRAVIARNPHHTSRLIIEHWGRKRDLFGPDWIGRAAGRDVEDQPYPRLAAWVAAGMREALANDEPKLETVQVQIRTASGRIRRRHYDRLLLPWTSPGGDAFATTINIPRPRN
ncbi:MAG TPA: hypothetical protein VHW66_22405 [Stellaceae bacterium]|nr:hypothetical protein [Stellaceae bacterium]